MNALRLNPSPTKCILLHLSSFFMVTYIHSSCYHFRSILFIVGFPENKKKVFDYHQSGCIHSRRLTEWQG